MLTSTNTAVNDEKTGETSISKPIIYTLSACPACLKLKQDWVAQGIDFEERQVDYSQAWLDEALKYGDIVPIIVYENGRVQIGYANMIGCYIA